MSQESQSPIKFPLLGAAIGGGLIGSLLTAGLLFVAAPQLLGPRIVREGIVRNPQVLVEGQEAVVRTAREALSVADEANDQPTLDLLTQRMQVHEKNAWMLRSLLKK